MDRQYCWRLQKFLPMLDEEEWAVLYPLLQLNEEKVKAYREQYRCDIPTARLACEADVVRKFEELTGVNDIRSQDIFYLRRSNYGPKCRSCDKLLRTPKAQICAECGHRRGIVD